ncbi:MAG: M20/M25/M40 family metallo-hydrolase [Proteobacteria bacterium]|nr:M20/M25/M40 family metallo-hydrolase [Burkholderiales bacterium]
MRDDTQDDTLQALRASIAGARADLVELCLQLGNLPSPHAQERAAAQFVLDWLTASGIEGWLQPITERSANVVGHLPGTGAGAGASLILNAHLDTGPALAPDAPDAERRIEGAWVDGELIIGKGVINDKGQLCAFMIAVRAIHRLGIRLHGDLYLTGVAFETGKPSVDAHQGIDFPGEGFGAKWLIDRGVTADFALVGETSGFGIVTAECGEASIKVHVPGKRVYTPRVERSAELGPTSNAFVKAAHLVVAIERWAVEYTARETRPFPGGRFVPKAQVVNVKGSEASGWCDIHVDVRIVPGKNPEHIRREIAEVSRALGVEAKVSVYQYSRGHIAQDAEPLIAALKAAHRALFDAEPPAPPAAETSMWRDVNVFNEVGIPAVCYGPPRQPEPFSGARDRAMKIDDLLAATQVYAATILNLCGVDRH